MTPAIVAALKTCDELKVTLPNDIAEPSLADPAVGNPVSHTQLIAVSKSLRNQHKNLPSYSSHLDDLLRGSSMYIQTPAPKAEPVC